VRGPADLPALREGLVSWRSERDEFIREETLKEAARMLGGHGDEMFTARGAGELVLELIRPDLTEREAEMRRMLRELRSEVEPGGHLEAKINAILSLE
jgi:hypothetical protein